MHVFLVYILFTQLRPEVFKQQAFLTEGEGRAVTRRDNMGGGGGGGGGGGAYMYSFFVRRISFERDCI
jgi:hypothetical protein